MMLKLKGKHLAYLLNKNKISNVLTDSLDATSKNIKGFASLVLANRNETLAISEIIKLTKDKRSMVRTCAFGALGHLKAKDIFLDALLDSNIKVNRVRYRQ